MGQLKTAVLGLGLSGLSAARFLYEQGVTLTVFETQAQAPHIATLRLSHPQISIQQEPWSIELFESFDRLCLSPGVDPKQAPISELVSRGLLLCNDIGLFLDALPAKIPVLAVTGTNGKSTVSALCAHLLTEAGLRVGLGGNIGVPALSLLQQDLDVVVLELSSFQLELLHDFRPWAASILNLSPDHLDRHGSMQAYLQAKRNCIEHSRYVIYNREQAFLSEHDNQALSFGLSAPEPEHYGILSDGVQSYLARGETSLIATAELPLAGQHNWTNALAAIALAQTVTPIPNVTRALKSFNNLAHRCEDLGLIAGVRWFNDSKGTNPGATHAALQGLRASAKQWVLILGGISKGADFKELTPIVVEVVRAVVILGRATPILLETFQSLVPCYPVTSLQDAVCHAQKIAQVGDGVLFSPACASFDMFENYSARGEAFRTLVRQMREDV